MEDVNFNNDDILWLMRIQQQLQKNTSKFHHQRFFIKEFKNAALTGDVTRLKVLTKRANKYFTNKDQAFTLAVKTEQLDFVIEMLHSGYRPKVKVAAHALNEGVANGALSTVAYMLKNTTLDLKHLQQNALATANKLGHSPMINMLSYYKHYGDLPTNNYFVRPIKDITPKR